MKLIYLLTALALIASGCATTKSEEENHPLTGIWRNIGYQKRKGYDDTIIIFHNNGRFSWNDSSYVPGNYMPHPEFEKQYLLDFDNVTDHATCMLKSENEMWFSWGDMSMTYIRDTGDLPSE
ncbi:MAG: hypothetical protein AAF558_15120 [Verrucomicrobiota bacterium]